MNLNAGTYFNMLKNDLTDLHNTSANMLYNESCLLFLYF